MGKMEDMRAKITEIEQDLVSFSNSVASAQALGLAGCSAFFSNQETQAVAEAMRYADAIVSFSSSSLDSLASALDKLISPPSSSVPAFDFPSLVNSVAGFGSGAGSSSSSSSSLSNLSVRSRSNNNSALTIVKFKSKYSITLTNGSMASVKGLAALAQSGINGSGFALGAGITGILTSKVQMDGSSDYTAFADISFPNKAVHVANEAVNLVTKESIESDKRMVGSVNQWATQTIWNGTSIPSFRFSLAFYAVNSTRDEVMSVARALYAWPFPSIGLGGFLASPVGITDADRCTVTIGNYLHIPNLNPTSCSINFDQILDAKDYMPIRVDVEMGFQYYRMPSFADVQSWFLC